jgi:DNA-binding MarR family transcriptional regulator
VSRELGPKQLYLLQWAGRWRGAPVGMIADELGVGERRARKIVESLVERGLVVVVDDPDIGRRVWTPEAHDRWVWVQRNAVHFREAVLIDNGVRYGVDCDACGHFVETATPTRPRHSYRPHGG